MSRQLIKFKFFDELIKAGVQELKACYQKRMNKNAGRGEAA
jgi:hypothetical protein